MFEFIVGAVISLVSAGLGYAGSVRAAKRAMEAQMDSTALAVYLNTRLTAYRDFESALADWSANKTRNTTAALYNAVNVIRLVASESTSVCAGELCEMVRACAEKGTAVNRDAFFEAHAKVLMSMQEDLLHYPMPKKVESPTPRS